MTTTTASKTLTATPAKLRDGSWGARVAGSARQGDVVTITTRAGKRWDARVTRVVWSGDDVTIVATASLDRAPAPSSYVERVLAHEATHVGTRTAPRPTSIRRVRAFRPCGYPGCHAGYCDECGGADGDGSW